MLLADSVRDYAAGVLGRTEVEAEFARLERRARRESPGAAILRSADLRYQGQSYELNVPWPKGLKSFHEEHHRVYGYSSPERVIEVVTIRVRARTKVAKPRLGRLQFRTGKPSVREVWIAGSRRKAKIWRREGLPSSKQRGPALVLDYGATTVIPPEWQFRADSVGNLVISR
jgi:N-methylhydantoinase A